LSQPYRAEIEVYDSDLYLIHLNDASIPNHKKGWTKKNNPSTFFPSGWDENKIMEEIAFSLKNINSAAPVISSGSKYYDVICQSGFKIRIYIDDVTNQIKSAHPVI
jgi:Bacterial EndoU nuclease